MRVLRGEWFEEGVGGDGVAVGGGSERREVEVRKG